ncbi:antibiotic biosynthesis monooxygenase family protein [Nocardia sp. alder85J]|uniref:antibiotic biosynthesis monooxygenase family protein n=1 Tax=Nocardia sp. alder85J TaxID=2862949 RepID=UPI001CD553AE|nr:antibiotic biosynthesis monooxygenase family protein [Nocardia sp. alder85J]MCX4094709.1 antibiotic biosynthesis monooxygenase [Nocardia sp. alder85J]
MTDEQHELGPGRVVFLIRVAPDRERDFLAAYEGIRHLIAQGVPGHVVDQVCRSPADPEQWLITSEWRDLRDFYAWESDPEHRRTVAPLRACFTDGRSMKFVVVAETGSTGARDTTSSAAPGI